MTDRRSILGGAVALAALSACQQAPAPQAATPFRPISFAPVNGVGYLVFNAPIFAPSRDLFIADIDRLVDAGARTVRIGVSSPGGDVDAARGIVDYMNRVHATRGVEFEAYAVGLVASAATYVFLSAQRRYARPNSGFLFHAAGMVSSGAVSAERLREEANKIDDYERAVRAVLKARTRLTDGAIDVYLHRTVILNADDARRDGVVDAIAPFQLPPNSAVPGIVFRPPQPAAARPSAADPSMPGESR
jgi:ATP-dependent protease ClpP protease subunit